MQFWHVNSLSYKISSKSKPYAGAVALWCRAVVVITTAQLHSTKPELMFCAGSNLAHGMSEICGDVDLGQWSWLEIRLNTFCWSTIPQKQFIIIIMTKLVILSLKCLTFWLPYPTLSVFPILLRDEILKREALSC